ncbi:MAG: hypothetical protein KGL39_12140 [Patescibacteria group bacterium]|nr:hypothetical protein [Patescibacteria group bacterium]
MADVVVTVPKGLWYEWLDEGDLAKSEGPAPWNNVAEYHFWIPPMVAVDVQAGNRVYVVAHGKLRGYAPLVRLERVCKLRPSRSCLVRRGDAVAVTIDEPIRGFQGFRYRWWERSAERPFPNWMEP